MAILVHAIFIWKCLQTEILGMCETSMKFREFVFITLKFALFTRKEIYLSFLYTSDAWGWVEDHTGSMMLAYLNLFFFIYIYFVQHQYAYQIINCRLWYYFNRNKPWICQIFTHLHHIQFVCKYQSHMKGACWLAVNSKCLTIEIACFKTHFWMWWHKYTLLLLCITLYH